MLQLIEKLSASSLGVFLAQPRDGLLQHRKGPATIEQHLWWLAGGRLEPVSPFLRLGIQRKHNLASSSLLGAILFPLVRKKMFQAAQQKRAEFSAFGIRNTQMFALQQPRKKLLSQIFGI